MRNAMCSRLRPPVGWSVNHQTHPAIAQAIYALAEGQRTPEAIWKAPTAEEWRSVSELVVEYISVGDYTLDSGRFAWGTFETLRLSPTW